MIVQIQDISKLHGLPQNLLYLAFDMLTVNQILKCGDVAYLGMYCVEDLFSHNGEAGIKNLCSFFLENTDDLMECKPLVYATYQNHLQVRILVPHLNDRHPKFHSQSTANVLDCFFDACP